ncbi:MAG: hypothetical protein WBD56_09030, partial [Anaerolineales bacterium]
MLYTWKHKVGGVYDDPDRKKNFHKETRKFLQAVSEHLSEYPLLDLQSNKGGIAVLGEIYVKWKIDDTRCIEAWMEQSVMRPPEEVLFCVRISEYKIDEKGKVGIG